jgi:hypothetical protein
MDYRRNNRTNNNADSSETNLQSIVLDFLQDYLSTQTPLAAPTTGGVGGRASSRTRGARATASRTPPTTNTGNEQYVGSMSALHTIRDIMTGYNTNMRDYQQNVRELLNIMTLVQTNINLTSRDSVEPSLPATPIPTPVAPPTPTPISIPVPAAPPASTPITSTPTPTPTPPVNPLTASTARNQFRTAVYYSPYINSDIDTIYSYPSTRTNLTLERTFQDLINAYIPEIRNMDDVVVRPTMEQIQSSTERIQYCTEVSNASCPITLEEFQLGDEVIRIRHCGHTFRPQALDGWFRGNVRCPMCRYDIRDYSTETTSRVSSTSNNVVDNSLNAVTSPTEYEDEYDYEFECEIQLTTNINSVDMTNDDDDEYNDMPALSPMVTGVDISANSVEPPTTPIREPSHNILQIPARPIRSNIARPEVRNLSTAFADQLINRISTTLFNYIQPNTDASNNLLYEFTIPLYDDDFSSHGMENPSVD